MIFHIAYEVDWERAQVTGEYMPASLQSEGFIHCSTSEQVEYAGKTHFKGETGLVLLEIDPEKLDVPVVYEDLYEVGEQFPHLYGVLPLPAVIAVHPFSP